MNIPPLVNTKIVAQSRECFDSLMGWLTEMQRDMDLIRKLLLYIEERSANSVQVIDVAIDGYSPEQISHHLWLLADGGFIKATTFSNMNSTYVMPSGLTWSGAEFLDEVRSKDLWQQTLSMAKRGGIGSLNAIFDIAKALGRKKLEKLLELDS